MLSPLRAWLHRLWNVAVVAALLGLAYWGHLTHWHIPSLHRLVNADASAAPAEEKTASPGRANGYHVVEFLSPEVVRQVGIGCGEVEERDIDCFVPASANVEYDQTRVAQLSSRVAGFVWKVQARQGQFVRKGDLLAIVDSPEVGQARTDFLQEFSAHYFAAKRSERLHELAKQGAVSDASLREADLAALETRVRCFNAQQKLLNMGLDIDLDAVHEETPAALAQRIQTIGISAAALLHLKPAPKSANLIPLFAPSDGIITQFDLVAGQRTTPDRSEIEIADVRTMWVQLSVRREDAGRLALGQAVAYVSAAGRGNAVEGRLHWISTGIDEKTRTVQARASLNNLSLHPSPRQDDEGPWALRANEYGAAQIKVGAIANAILVPREALQRLEKDDLVFVLRPDAKSFEARKVQIGESQDGWVQIIGDVRPGERVATVNSFVLKSELLKNGSESP